MEQEQARIPTQDSPTSERPDERAERRDRSSDRRDETSDRRDETREDRDRTAEDRDRTSEGRDRSAEARDRVDDTFEVQAIAAAPGTERRGTRVGRRKSDLRAASGRASAASDRVEAASDRADAASDREAAWISRQRGALDRTQASDDRDAASQDRDASAQDREASSIDELTGAYRRGAGLVELERELLRAERTRQSFVLAFVDVDRLKATNDSLGHGAGDQLLRHVVDITRGHVRSYDLVVRFGGDEFLCALSDLDLAEVTKRFQRINRDLTALYNASITVGLAELGQDDSLVTLISRADKALYAERGRAQGSNSN